MAGLAVLALGACSADGGSEEQRLGYGQFAGESRGGQSMPHRSEQRNEWRLAMLTQSAAQQQAWEDKICGCASEEAPIR